MGATLDYKGVIPTGYAIMAKPSGQLLKIDMHGMPRRGYLFVENHRKQVMPHGGYP